VLPEPALPLLLALEQVLLPLRPRLELAVLEVPLEVLAVLLRPSLPW
jgi:hypothetical protein